ncbi:hypothetical protein FGU65_09270 [Methanoculleus sp. FWC-SCC1]|uniref:Uncharacterized protein n=1 Tax=Methanoculleus frigidifontis TaxID=2584085 RepID=A0ABT8MAW2_9EURY|nr:hypothetical protein [Methanoculleus sp. FWC-SCC1]MDN7025074.1 hypothetical protein [Methanoculleus sp. FWC-SCC1]
MENPEKYAVCLACGNEWEVRDPGVKKKRKCPICGKYRVKLKSDIADDIETPPEHPGAEAAPGENTRSPPGEGENTPEKTGEKEEKAGEEKGGGWLVLAALIVLAVMACSFLWSALRPEQHNARTPQRRYQRPVGGW